MDIIAAHQHGLIEQLEEEVQALAGRPNSYAQRAIVLHHLFDHSRGSHGWALAEARRNLRTEAGLMALGRRIGRWGWLIADRDDARTAHDLLAHALGEASRLRTEAAYRAYRLTATPALRGEAERTLPRGLLAALDQCHRARRAGEELSPEIRRTLMIESEELVAQPADTPLTEAWPAIEATSLGRAAQRLLGAKALACQAERDERRGWENVERALRHDRALPAAFRANPAQHFYVLQHSLAERRRQRWREACDREPGAFELAA